MGLARLVSALDVAEAYAVLNGAIKGRDPKEPGRQQKLLAETKFQATVRRMFRSQLDAITRWANVNFQPWQYQTFKATLPSADEEIDKTEEAWRAEFYRIYLSAIMDGIDLWGRTAKFDLDYTKINPEAVKAAQRMSLYFLREVDKTTKTVIRDVIRQFVDTPGMTLGDVIKMLPFDAQRAERIAITEITRAYAQANTNIGAELKREFPNVPVVKFWFTNQDDRVCDICGPLDTGKPVPFDKPFNAELGIDSPPAHPNCRCWSQVTTNL
jgi:hypothetical protein